MLRHQPSAARLALRRARAHFARNRQSVHVAFCDRILATLQATKTAARARLAASRAVFARHGQRVDVALCDLVRGELHVRWKEWAAAERDLYQAARVLKHFPAYHARIAYGLGRVHAATQPRRALRDFLQAAQAVAHLRHEVGLEGLSNVLFGSWQHLFAAGLELAERQRAADAALHIIEAAKAQLFLRVTTAKDWRNAEPSERIRALRAQEQALRYRLDQARERLIWQPDAESPLMRGARVASSSPQLGELAKLARTYEQVVGELQIACRGLKGIPPCLRLIWKRFVLPHRRGGGVIGPRSIIF